MGLIKKIKGSYMFTQLEVGKYTKRRGNTAARDASAETTAPGMVRAATTEFVSEFDRAAEEAQRERQWQQREAEKRRQRHAAGSNETLPVAPLDHSTVPSRQVLGRHRSSMELSASQRDRYTQSGTLPYAALQSPQSAGSQTTTVASTPDGSPFTATADSFGTDQPIPRPRPRGARGARSTVDMQSVYFAPGRNVTMTNQQKQRMSVYPVAEDKPSFDKNSASSTDYYVFTPARRDVARMPLDARRKTRALVAPEENSGSALHEREVQAEADRAAAVAATNPFVERRRKAHVLANEGWNSASPFDDPLVGSGRGGIDPNDPRKHLNTPMYANQAGSGGLDLLA
ncbi:hypothetical protein GGI07_003842 [Coemansia sp. Benny D115]|nr:hypothetical protein GGI07_003842 [Coemansia sp. Benny D115]